MPHEIPVRFGCDGASLYGVVHAPFTPRSRGVLVVVGGPQYRVGSHRQFVLLARSLAQAGVPVMRFDYRGMGDGEGEPRTFEDIEADIRAAMEQFVTAVPGLREIVLWGLCDAASAALFYGARDARVTGLVLLNPWVRTEAGIAGAYLKSYYGGRLLDRNFWRKVWRGEIDIAGSVRSFLQMAKTSLGFGAGAHSTSGVGSPLPDRMYDGLQRFRGRVLLILSGDDLTAEEFRNVTRRSHAWHGQLHRSEVTCRELAPANHTFSQRVWRDQVADWTREWVQSW